MCDNRNKHSDWKAENPPDEAEKECVNIVIYGYPPNAAKNNASLADTLNIIN